MNIYDCQAMIDKIEALAEANEGELPEAEARALIEAQTTSLTKLARLGNYMAYLNGQIELCKQEADRIAKLKKSTEKRIANIKDWLLPYVSGQGRPVKAGTHTFSTRKSKGVVLAEDFSNPEYIVVKEVKSPDKKKIKADIENGIEVKGAVLENRISLQFK